MSARRGTVWFESTRVGSLVESAEGDMRFCYDADWLESGFPISLSVPLADQEADAHAFFAGLLPEGLARQRICRQYRLREDDDFGLLLAIGRDCAGALAVLDEGAQPEAEDFIGGNNVPERITRDEWSAHARAIGAPERVLLQRLEQMANELPALAAAARASFAEQFGDNQAYDRLQESIADRCARTLRREVTSLPK
jgi:HipA-like protein